MGELIYGKGGWGASSSHPALPGGGKCVSSPGSWPASGNAAQGSVTNRAGRRGSQSARGSQVTREAAWLWAWRLHRGAG